ncbi:1-hydroxy-2-methyl-2-(E)-butenyl 4-diphosphate synthase [Hydrogenobacter thermophilus TK-6]|uniref:4-hydroxy-3-methylbut-2-en-1-yl diphosphate synthase (flavodoxin) n=1 Tax=Hydrogenobacter thermophilus (strain DSM 6534 / IAM 12695 / TK-6) TaxID=608538 RepID=D3DFD3_HYDTT|nr:flavodoxin-dependent (E)-4-hydroxy-3-methylbut-2-enyl-diphosphate synthase [Hydrogenobacter thermophilus]ADO44479.1 1-hydroxy-2-methyl-2-(E)-butenyl 4-diphosphate synthase [Hydrogenobacter thermophilus TK-6]BAI68535.1 4-hydroxy-3-methylbut-2-en-1-yl diphosphate synthase [Hydrogenobacter thermophilus TK-6]
MSPKRRKTRQISVGWVKIGGDAPIVVQSMTSTKTHQVEETLQQIERLHSAGCELIRVAVPHEEDLEALPDIVKNSPIPVIADIHFAPSYAFRSMEKGVHGIRINPGNIGKEEIVREIVQEAKKKGVAIRIGVNSGSLEKDLLEKYGYPCAEALFESAMRWSEKLEKWGFDNFKVSIKGSDVLENIKSNLLFAERTNIPLHIGITEAGMGQSGIVKSSVGIGILLYLGIGDTVRVSLTDDPEVEVKVAYDILRSLGIRRQGVEIVACPTCGRIEVDLPKVVMQVKEKLKDIKEPLKIAIMGCVVNAIGEAREADLGLACGRGFAWLFKRGKPIRKVSEGEMAQALLEEVLKYKSEL